MSAHLLQMLWELIKVSDGREMLAVLRIILQAALEAIQGRDAEDVHLGGASLLQGFQYIAQSNTQIHVPEHI